MAQNAENAGLNRNGFISRRKYCIFGLADFLSEAARGRKKEVVAKEWGIPLRTLNDIEHLSAVSLPNWQKLQSALRAQIQRLRDLCPEGWGGNKHLTKKAGRTLPPGTAIHWKFIQWEVDVRIENAGGDAEYQTNIHVENITEQALRLGPMHSVWAPNDAGVSLSDIRAYDQEGPLQVVGDVGTPTFLTFRIKSRRAIPPGQFWRYWWEVTWPKAYADWDNGDLTYKGEAPVNELILKLVLPRGVRPSGRPTLKMPDGTRRNLSWLKLHGRDATVFCQREAPISETMKIQFKCVIKET